MTSAPPTRSVLLVLPFATESLNVRDRKHWSARQPFAANRPRKSSLDWPSAQRKDGVASVHTSPTQIIAPTKPRPSTRTVMRRFVEGRSPRAIIVGVRANRSIISLSCSSSRERCGKRSANNSMATASGRSLSRRNPITSNNYEVDLGVPRVFRIDSNVPIASVNHVRLRHTLEAVRQRLGVV